MYDNPKHEFKWILKLIYKTPLLVQDADHLFEFVSIYIELKSNLKNMNQLLSKESIWHWYKKTTQLLE